MTIQQMMLRSRTSQPLTVEVEPPTLFQIGNTATITTLMFATATASGGTGSYSYTWEKVSGDAIVPVDGNHFTTQFQGTGFSPQEVRVAVYRCKVDDGDNVAYSPSFPQITLSRE